MFGALVALGCLMAASAQAVRFDVSFTGQYTQLWHAIPDEYPCSIIGSGSQTIRFRGHRVVQLFGFGNPRHPLLQTALPARRLSARTPRS